MRRYASLCLPMDEALILCAVDLSGRGGNYEELAIPTEKIGSFDTQLVLSLIHIWMRAREEAILEGLGITRETEQEAQP